MSQKNARNHNKLIMSSVWFFLCIVMLMSGFGGYIFDFMETKEFFGAKSESSIFKSVLGAVIFFILGCWELSNYLKSNKK